MYIENETDLDLTARMLRRKSIEEVEAIADEQGVWAEPNRKSYIADREFLYEHGYTIDEWFAAHQDAKVYRASKQIREGLEKHMAAKAAKSKIATAK